MATKRRLTRTDLPQAVLHAVETLHLDSKNPRIAATGVRDDQQEILAVLWREFAVDEIALSIAQNGFFQYEPLFASKEGGQLVVIEGNRRLAAVKLLLNGELRKALKATDLPAISPAVRQQIQRLPVIVCEREELWKYLAFRHVNGPQAWEPDSKSDYIAWVHNELQVPLDQIARTIGDTNQTVQRLYRARMVLEQAERTKLFDRKDRWKQHFSYSHLYTGLGYGGIQKFLGIDDAKTPKRNPVPPSKSEHLELLLGWLYGSKSKELPPLVRSQNPDLRRLDEALQSKQGLVALRRGLPLDVSLDIARGDERLFREKIQASKQDLQGALGTVLTGYKGERDLYETAEEILSLAKKLHSEMTEVRPSRSSPRKRG